MSAVFEKLGRLRPDQHRPLVLLDEHRASGVFVLAQPFVPLLEVQGFKLLARFPGHGLLGKSPELFVAELIKGRDSLDELRRELALHGSCGRNRVQELGFKAAVSPLRTLLKALVESFWKVKGDGMGCHGSDS